MNNRFNKPSLKKRITESVNFSVFFFAVVIAIFLVGISFIASTSSKDQKQILTEAVSKDELVGTWVQKLSDGTETLTLNDDMTYTKVIELGGSVPVKTTSEDTWSLSGSTITIQNSKYSTSSDYTVTVDDSTMTWVTGDSQIVYEKK